MEKRPPYLKNRRLRVFGGPNGSGKSTILEQINAKYNIGFYINADEIEKLLKTTQFVDLSEFGIQDYKLKKFRKLIGWHSIVKKAKKDGFPFDLFLEDNKIKNPDKTSHSYEAAFIADILRNTLLDEGKKFAFETVMSHQSKVDYLSKSSKQGYKNYLYYISTESPLINIERVNKESN